MYRKAGKRLFDFVLSALAFAIFLPVFILIATYLLIVNRGKVFFLQERPGYNERPFKVIKFKTMNDRRDAAGNLLPNHIRTTPVGSFLRKTSLDEIPQLVNVISGHMSLVGPRPLLFKYVPLYSAEQKRRHDVRPGITGWAQVNGRNSISWTKKFELDVYYVNNLSLELDIRILWLTLRKVLKREGINAGQEVTMPPFDGSN